MKRLRQWLLAACILLLAAAGAAMPFAASRMQDAQQAEAEVRTFDSFRLTLREESDLSRILDLLARSDYYVADAEKSETARLTRPEAQHAAEEAMAALFEHGLLDAATFKGLDIPTVWPQTLIANDESALIPTWTVQWDSSYLWLDDATGKAILITIPGPYLDDLEKDRGVRENLYMKMDAWRLFLEDYYGVKVEVSDAEEWYDAAANFTFTFPLGAEGEQEKFQLMLYIYYMDSFTTLSPYVS